MNSFTKKICNCCTRLNPELGTEDDFNRLYNVVAHEALKQEYDPAGRLPGLYEKCVRGR